MTVSRSPTDAAASDAPDLLLRAAQQATRGRVGEDIDGFNGDTNDSKGTTIGSTEAMRKNNSLSPGASNSALRPWRSVARGYSMVSCEEM